MWQGVKGAFGYSIFLALYKVDELWHSFWHKFLEGFECFALLFGGFSYCTVGIDRGAYLQNSSIIATKNIEEDFWSMCPQNLYGSIFADTRKGQ
jgi:hypothetical protein